MTSKEYPPRVASEVAVDPHALDVFHAQIEDVEIQGNILLAAPRWVNLDL